MIRFGNSTAAAISIRPAWIDEQKMLEALQRRASLNNPGDRDALLANPDAIVLPIEQIADGCVFVAERDAIALSILFVAREIVRVHRGRPGITARWPWVVSFTFGLMHGFGFAGALAEVGLPQSSVPMALLFFNVGVEIGQLMFVGAVLTVIAVGWRAAQRLRWSQPAWLWRLAPYAIGGFASFWLVERVTAF